MEQIDDVTRARHMRDAARRAQLLVGCRVRPQVGFGLRTRMARPETVVRMQLEANYSHFP